MRYFLLKPHSLEEFGCAPALTLAPVCVGLIRRDVLEKQSNAEPGQQYAKRDLVSTARYWRCGYSHFTVEGQTCSLCNFANTLRLFWSPSQLLRWPRVVPQR